MDGNGRWAAQRGLPRHMGHQKGASVVAEICQAAKDAGVKYLTLYAFSTENWKRSDEEVSGLMKLLREYLDKNFKELAEKGVRIRFIGERYMLEKDILTKMEALEQATKNNTELGLQIALSYGSRQEIVNAARRIAERVKAGDISAKDVDEKFFSDMLYTGGIPDPDLVIRTGGEQRISNYLLWQPTYWPDFTKRELQTIIENFKNRERRYGKV
jgi:undecaprenyl diphosphate synthase